VAVASEHDVEHAKSLPSEELDGATDHEHVKGVGSLPGKVSESGVARLPDDRTPGTHTPAENVRATALDDSTPDKNTSTPGNSSPSHGSSKGNSGSGDLSTGLRKVPAPTQDRSGTSGLPFGAGDHEASSAGASRLEKGAIAGAGVAGTGLTGHSDTNTKDQASGSSIEKDTGRSNLYSHSLI